MVPQKRLREGMNHCSDTRWGGIRCLPAALALLVTFPGCSAFHSTRQTFPADSVREEIYDRANAEFANAALIKPVESSRTDHEAFEFAPLIIQEIAVAGRGDGLEGFGQASVSHPAAAPGHTTNATIYFHKGKVLVQGRSHEQFAYFWRSSEGAPIPESGATSRSCSNQGVRITLDSAGQPAIWEVLADPGGSDILFVSQSLEAAAVAGFGKALPGRRFSVERGLRDAPNTIVARVIDDGPLPMGPIVYLRAGAGDVGTLICRCMPAQVKRLVGESYYELVTVDGHSAKAPAGVTSRAAGERAAFWPEGMPPQRRLGRCLRLPANF
jgi:hypothetical protein